jgi:hypothetical protein
MKLRITQAGYENFTGEMGHIDFFGGVSIHDVNPDFARSLSGIVQTEPVVEITDEPATAPEGGAL